MKQSKLWFMDGKRYKEHDVSISWGNNNIMTGIVPQFEMLVLVFWKKIKHSAFTFKLPYKTVRQGKIIPLHMGGVEV
jgi:hypothetical protein